MSEDDLEPITPAEAMKLYLDHREPELSEKSVENHRYRLESFVEWCGDAGIENLNELTGRDLHRFRVWRRNGDGRYEEVSKVTLYGILSTLRKFLEFAASIDAVEQGLREKVLIPDVSSDEASKDERLEDEQAQAVLDYLERFHYASREHVIIGFLWHTGIRLGTLRGIDVRDFNAESGYVKIRHRPESGTPLKNKQAADRMIAVGDYWCDVVQDYIRQNRHDVTDDHGREPLLTSSQGRLSSTAVRNVVYRETRPCMYADCPHGRDPDDCEAMETDQASKCPSSRSPHGIRRGAITRSLREGVPEEIVSDRMNASSDVLEQHYDRRSEREKMELRREFLEDS